MQKSEIIFGTKKTTCFAGGSTIQIFSLTFSGVSM